MNETRREMAVGRDSLSVVCKYIFGSDSDVI